MAGELSVSWKEFVAASWRLEGDITLMHFFFRTTRVLITALRAWKMLLFVFLLAMLGTS
jgi:hypothetical protein